MRQHVWLEHIFFQNGAPSSPLYSVLAPSPVASFRCNRDVTDSCQRRPGFTPRPTAPPPQPTRPRTAGWETTGHRAGASLCGLEQGSQPDQYLCISCPFASGLFINNYWLAELQCAGWWGAKGRARVTFPRPLG